jgi:hypothetical protein
MASGSKYRIVGWSPLRCFGLFWNPPCFLLPILGLFMAVGEMAPGSVPG